MISYNSSSPIHLSHLLIPSISSLLLHILLPLLLFPLQLLNPLPLLLPHDLILSSDGDILGTIIAESPFQNLLDDPAETIIQNHQRGKNNFELGRELDQFEFLVDLRDELGRAAEGDAGDEQ